MAARAAHPDPVRISGTNFGARFEARDHRAVSRQTALRLARDATALPGDARRAYVRTLRSVAQRDGLAGLAALELAEPRVAEPRVAEPRATELRVAEPRVAEPEVVPRLERLEPRSVVSVPVPRRSASAIALTGVVVGMAAAVLLPASLSESLPGTSGSNREPLAPPGAAPSGADSGGSAASARADRSAARSERNGRTGRRSRARQQLRSVGPGGLSGKGNGTIGTLRIDRPMRLRWSTDGSNFAIASADWRFRPRTTSGSTVLTPGTYRQLAVRSTGRWKLKLEPAG